MTLLLNDEEVRASLDMPHLIDSIERGSVDAAYGRATVAPRTNLGAIDGFFRMMGGIVPSLGVQGFKVFNGALPGGVRYLVGIYSVESHALLALLDAAYLTAARTGATTGVATRHMARADARTVGVIGSGLEARTNLLGVCAVRPIDAVRVFSPTPSKREQFAKEMAEMLDVDVVAAETAQECVEDVDIVVVATNTSGRGDQIAYQGAWMTAGQHINSIGSTMPVLRECDAHTFVAADRVTIDVPTQAGEESGDLLAAWEAYGWDAASGTDLGLIAAGQEPGRGAAAERTLFKSVGSPLQDICAGWSVYEAARDKGVGQEIDFVSLKAF